MHGSDRIAPSTIAPGEATLGLTCTLPTTTLNGAWNLSVRVGSNGFAGRRATIPFTVIGGADDSSGPIVTVLTANPQPVTRGQTFSVRYDMEDPLVVMVSRVPSPAPA